VRLRELVWRFLETIAKEDRRVSLPPSHGTRLLVETPKSLAAATNHFHQRAS